MRGASFRDLHCPVFLRSWVLAALLSSTLSMQGQQPWSVGARGHYGLLWPHTAQVDILVEGYAPATELYVERRVKGDRPWHRTFGLPHIGLAAIHTRMANPEHIGDAIGLVPYIAMPFTHGQPLSFGMRIGWGMGWVTKPYDRRYNTQETAISTRLNAVVELMPELRYTRDRLSISTGLALNHWSNGSVKQPNLGLNFISLSIGASYALGPMPALSEPVLIDTAAFERPRREISVVGAYGINEGDRPFNGQYSVYSLSADVSWRIGLKGSLGAGADLFNKGNLSSVQPGLEGDPRLNFTQLGLHLSGALLMGRSELLFHFGGYVHTPVPDKAPVYQRFGFRHRIGKHLLASVCLKTHYAAADHWEFGLGYRWN